MSQIPIFVGEMTFNESNNTGFSADQVIAWTADDLKVTSAGKITGTFRVTTIGGAGENVVFKDILFLQVRGNYLWPNMCDTQHIPLSDVMPFLAQTSNQGSAEFRVDASFPVPPLEMDYSELLPLGSVAVNLTWVRVFMYEQDLYVQVFPGDADRYPPIPEVRFDRMPGPLTGRFGYYSQLPVSSLKGGRVSEIQGEFDYLNWIYANIRW